jgi:hypothetical protein
MTPPASHDLKKYYPHAPLSEWIIWRSFDSADDCEAVLTKKFLQGTHNGMLLAAQCIASDDPRLKGN